MRIRITRRRSGDVDGVALGGFEVGATYDVSSSVGTYLVTTRSAEAVAQAVGRPPSESRHRSGAPGYRDVAADQASPPKPPHSEG